MRDAVDYTKTLSESETADNMQEGKMQEVWLMHHYSEELQILARVGLCSGSIQKMGFRELSKLLQNPEAKGAASRLTQKLKEVSLPRVCSTGQVAPERIFLSAYMVASDSSMSDPSTGRTKDAELWEKASQLVSRVECLQNCIVSNSARGFVKMLRDLSASWTEFHDCFLAWKISDSALNLRELEKYKEANKQLLVATDKSAGAAIIWHPELHKYEYKIAEYEKIFSHSLNTSETSSYPPQSMSSNKRRGLNVSGLSNVQLAHEIAVNDKLVFSASSDNLSILVRECSLDLAGGNFNSKSVNAIVEIFSSNAETLQIFSKIGLLSNTHPDTRDVRCIPSLAEKKGIPDNPSHNMRLLIPVLVKFTETLKALGCRHIDEGRIQEIENLGSIPPEEIIPSLERSLNAILQSSQSCKVDGLNCSLSTIRGKLIGELIRYEREEFEKSTSASSYPAVALPNASKFINDSIVALFPPSSPEPLSLRASLWQIFSHGLASLVFCPAPVEEALIPETFKLDTKRIYHLWTVAYSIAIASSLLSYASLKHKISQPSIHALGTQLIALLGLGEAEYLDPESDPYISVENIELCMSRIIASSPSYVQHSGLKGSLDRQSLRSDIQNITSHNSPVLKLVLSRLKNHCIKTLCHKSVLAPNPSDFILAKSLSEVTSHFLSAVLRLAKYNFDTYGPYYNMLLDYPTEQNQSKVAR